MTGLKQQSTNGCNFEELHININPKTYDFAAYINKMNELSCSYISIGWASYICRDDCHLSHMVNIALINQLYKLISSSSHIYNNIWAYIQIDTDVYHNGVLIVLISSHMF